MTISSEIAVIRDAQVVATASGERSSVGSSTSGYGKQVYPVRQAGSGLPKTAKDESSQQLTAIDGQPANQRHPLANS